MGVSAARSGDLQGTCRTLAKVRPWNRDFVAAFTSLFRAS